MENLKEKQTRTKRIFETLDPIYTKEKTALIHNSALELLIATILSAQCTDTRVNKVTKHLFEKYRKPEDYLDVPVQELEKDIKPTGFFRNKAKSIRGCCQILIDMFGGKIPSTMEEMLTLPGVGRKTANCVLGALFDVPGIVVDTHVKRLSTRLGLTQNKDAEKIEQDLGQLLPKKRWRRFSDILIYHGRKVCKARKADCSHCIVADLCPSIYLT